MKRYPGIRPFTAEDQHLFFGRKKEIRDLFQMAILNDIIVLFGKSGTGKSSLLNAGVSPLFENRNLHPVFIRLNNTEVPLEEQLYKFLYDNNYIPKDTPSGLTLWEYLKYFWYVDLGETFTPVIIVDQFEELFTLYSPEQRKSSIDQFADVINGRMPASLRKKLKDPNVSLDPTIDWQSPPDVKFILAIRSDYLYLLNGLSTKIPSILRNRFELGMLDRSTATQAITLPAMASGAYESPTFNYKEEALNEIIEVLGKKEADQLDSDLPDSELEIEAFQLQLFCQQIENKVIAEKKTEGFLVTSDFFGGKAGVQKIIGEFYSDVVSRVSQEHQEDVETMVATKLIRNKRRIIMEESAILQECNIPQDVLDQLHEERLLRKEARSGNFYYEISHDTLIRPILRKYKRIFFQKEEERLEQERLEKEKELAAKNYEEQKKLRKAAEMSAIRAKRRTTTAIVAMVFALILAVIAGYSYFKAKQANEIANNKEELAKQANEIAKDAIEIGRDSSLSNSVKSERLNEINNKLKKEETKQVEQPVLKGEQRQLITNLYSSNESTRKNAKLTLIRNHTSDSSMIKATLEKSNGRINEKNVNNIYQIIDYLKRCDSAALQKANTDKSVSEFIKAVNNNKRTDGNDLVGPKTKRELKQIEAKL